MCIDFSFLGLSVISGFGFSLNLYFCISTLILFTKHRLPSRRYSLLVNVAIGDIIVSGTLFGICISIIFFAEKIDAKKVMIFFFLIPPLGISMIMITYISLNIFQIIAILNPIFYMTRVVVKHSYVICGLSWLSSITIGIVLGTDKNILIPSPGYMKGLTVTELGTIFSYFIIIVATYITIIAKTSGTRFCVKTRITKSRKRVSWKLGLHFLVLVVTVTPSILISFEAVNSLFGTEFRIIHATPCYTRTYEEAAIKVKRILIAEILLLCRGATDPLIHIFWEKSLINPFGTYNRQNVNAASPRSIRAQNVHSVC